LNPEKLKEIQGLIKNQQNSLITLAESYNRALQRNQKMQEYFWKEGFIVDENKQFQKDVPADILILLDATITEFSRFRLDLFEIELGYTQEFQDLKKKEEHESRRREERLKQTTIFQDPSSTRNFLKLNLSSKGKKEEEKET